MKYEPEQKVFEYDAVSPALTPGGTTVVLSYLNPDSDEPLNIGLRREKAELLHHQLGLLLGASLDNPPPGVPGFVRMTDVIGVDAGPTDMAGKVVLSLTVEGGSVHHFRLARELSAALRPRMRNAEASPPAKPPRAKH